MFGIAERRAQRHLELDVARAQAEFQMRILRQAGTALENQDPQQMEFLQAYVNSGSIGASIGGPADEVTPHDKYLDRWRIAVTGALVGALFVVIVLILIRQSIASSATPYVSLLSGLAGIALGWMFASAGGNATQRGSRSTPTAGSGRTTRRSV